MSEERIEKEEMERTLRSLDSISRADAPPFFFTRLEAKINSGSGAGNFRLAFSAHAFSVAALLLLLILNISVITHFTKRSQASQHTVSGIQELATEIDHDISTVYTDKLNP